MEDNQIVQLYWERNPDAIAASEQAYGPYCTAIAMRILGVQQDAEECVNDTWFSAWNAMPPHRPARLATFFGKLTRNLSLNRYARDHAEKRGGSEFALVLDELGEVVSGRERPETALERRELASAIDSFLAGLSKQKRQLFLRRYWYAESIQSLAEQFGMTENHVSVTLKRIRAKLRMYLTERGFDL